MKRFSIALPLAVTALALGGCQQKDMDGKVVQVKGSYARTCRNVAQTASGALTAECLDAVGKFHTSSVQPSPCRGDLANINGTLTCSQ